MQHSHIMQHIYGINFFLLRYDVVCALQNIPSIPCDGLCGALKYFGLEVIGSFIINRTIEFLLRTVNQMCPRPLFCNVWLRINVYNSALES